MNWLEGMIERLLSPSFLPSCYCPFRKAFSLLDSHLIMRKWNLKWENKSIHLTNDTTRIFSVSNIVMRLFVGQYLPSSCGVLMPSHGWSVGSRSADKHISNWRDDYQDKRSHEYRWKGEGEGSGEKHNGAGFCCSVLLEEGGGPHVIEKGWREGTSHRVY